VSNEDKKDPLGKTPESDALHDHERVDALMPWIRRGDLEKADRDVIEDELTKSPSFKAKLAQEKELAAALEDIAADEVAEDAANADAAWAKFKTRLPVSDVSVPEGAPPQAQPLPRSRASAPTRTSAWRRFRLPQTNVGWLATAQTAALAAMAFLFIPGQLAQTDGEYRTLSSDGAIAPAPAGNAVVMFDPSTDLATMQQALSDAGARIVDGPMANGGYVIALEDGTLDKSLEALRSNEVVVLAQPLSTDAQP